MKQGVACLLFSLTALSAAAAGDRYDVAVVGNDSHRRSHGAVIAPRVTESCEYYEVTGQDEKELRDQLTQHGNTWRDGKKYDSVTAWRVKWDYGYQQAEGTCGVEVFRASLDITFRYPKWVRNDDAPRLLTEKWDSYLQNLVMHEQGHRDLAVEAAADLSRAVAGLPPARSCAELDRQVRRLCHERMKQLNRDSEAYDEGTVHGFAQGAVFP